MKFFAFLAAALLANIIGFSQRIEDIRLKDRLMYHYTFDGDLDDLAGKSDVKILSTEGSLDGQFFKGPLIYPDDKFIQVSRSFLTYAGIREEVPADDSIRTYGFWIKVEDDPNKADSTLDSLGTLMKLRVFDRDTLLIRLSALKKQVELTVGEGEGLRKLVELELGKWYYITMQLILTPSQPSLTLSLFESDKKGSKADLKAITLDNSRYQEVWRTYLHQMLAAGTNRMVTIGFLNNNKHRTQINDLRVYRRALTGDDISFIAQYSLDDGRDDLKLQLAMIYKKLADELFMAQDYANAEKYYENAEKLTNATGEEAINVQKLSKGDIDILQYKLLQKDIAYRKLLLDGGYTFWGIEFSNTPLIPTEEVHSFQRTFERFEQEYDNIVRLQKDGIGISNEVVETMINNSTELYNNEISQQKKHITEAKVNLVEVQIGDLKNRIRDIEVAQQRLSDRVRGYEEELKKNEEAIVSTITKAISESTIGVRISSVSDLSKNFKETAFQYLTNHPEIKASLLGSANDIVNTVQASYDYYNKAKQGIEVVKATVSGSDISPEQIVSLGDAIVSMDFVSNNAKKNWEIVKGQYQSVDELRSKANELLNIAAKMEHGSFDSWTQLTDYIAGSGYFSEYEQSFERFTEFPRAAYEAYQSKKYDALLKLGSAMLDTVVNNSGLPQINVMRQDLKKLKDEYGHLKPLFTAIQIGSRDSIVKAILFETIFDPKVVQYFNDKSWLDEFVWAKLQTLFTGNTNYELQQYIIAEFSARAPQIIATIMTPDAKAALKNAFNVFNDNDLISKIKSSALQWHRIGVEGVELSMPNNVTIRIKGDTILVRDQRYKLYFDPTKADKVGDILSYARRLLSNAKLKVEWTRHIYTADFANLFQDRKLNPAYRNRARKQDIYQVFEDNLDRNGQKSKDSAIQEEAYRLAIGTVVMENYKNAKGKELYKEIPPLNMDNFYINETQTAQDQKDAMMRNMATKAIDMAFPGIGTAVGAVIDVLGSVFDSYDIINQLQEIYKEKVALRTEMLTKLDQLQATRQNSQIANYEKEIAEITLELSQKRLTVFNSLIKDALDEQAYVVRRRMTQRLPLFYYYAERLRYYYQRLNKASTFWYGPENTLDKLLRSDKGNIRLALDESIRIFDWISNPDITSARQDIDSLHDFWSKRAALVQQEEKQIEYGGSNVDQAEVQLIRVELSKDFPEQWNKLALWKQAAKNKPESIILDLSASFNNDNTWNLHADYSSVKVLKVGFVGINKQGARIDVPIALSHPGFSKNEDGTFQVLKTDRPMTASEERLQVMSDGLPDMADPNVLSTLRTRWVDVNVGNYTRYKYEGYNFRAKWNLEFKSSKSIEEMNKFYLVFAVQTNQKTINTDSEELQYPYQVKIQSTKTSPADSYTLICSSTEYERILKSIHTAIKSNLIESGSISPLTNGNSIEVYGR